MCVIGGEGGIFYLVYRIAKCGVGRHRRLLVTITPLLQSMCGSGILWCLTGTWCCECLLHLAYVLAICVCVWCSKPHVMRQPYLLKTLGF